MPDPTDPATPPPKLPPRWVRPVLLVAAWAMGLVAVADVTENFSRWDRLPALIFVLAPVLLLFALFDARRGVERGYAAETGILPGLLLFGASMFFGGSVTRFVPHASVLGLLLLTIFVVVRTDPPATLRVRLAWMPVAAASVGWCVHVESGVWGSVIALVLYAEWSRWRAQTRLSVPPARSMIGALLLVALMDVPVALWGKVQFVTVPLSVAAGLIGLDVCSPVLRPANRSDPLPQSLD